MSIDKTGPVFGFTMYCDFCDETQEFDQDHDSFLEMIAEAKSYGWKMKKLPDGSWEHTCLECSKQPKEEQPCGTPLSSKGFF